LRVNALINASIRQSIYDVCSRQQQTTTCFIYKIWPVSNMPSNNLLPCQVKIIRIALQPQDNN